MTTDESKLGNGLRWIQRRFLSAYRSLVEADAFELSISLTILLVLLHPGYVWHLRIVMRMLAIAAILHRPLAHSSLFWLLLFLIHGSIQNVLYWYISDNHQFLFSYWFLALAIALSCQQTRQVASTNARWLLGLTFAFAAFRKLLAPEYLSGETFHFLLLNDGRFAEVAKVFGGIQSLMADSPGPHMALLEPKIPVPHSSQLTLVAGVLTWWTIITEALIAYAFMRPRSDRWDMLANGLLIYFILAVYSVAPVLGFAMILITLGYAQCPDSFKKTRLAYLGVLIFVQIFTTRHFVSFIFEKIERLLS